MTSSQSDLTERLRQKLETERLEIEKTATRELRRLGKSLNGVASDALHSIEADMAASTGRMHVLLMRAWVRPLVMGLSLFLGISGGSWATMHWLSASIESRIRTVAVLNVNIKQARETLAQLEETTWGVTLNGRSTGSGSWCCRPARWTIRPGEWAGGLP